MSGSGPKWLSPSDPWHHPKPWFDRALAYARAAGWWYRKAGDSGHIHGTGYCQPPDERARACKYVVFSTGVVASLRQASLSVWFAGVLTMLG